MTSDEQVLRRAVQVATRLGGGGLVSLREAFARVGEASVFDSWVAVGPNQPTTEAVIRMALADGLTALSLATGRDVQALACALTDLLPRIVDDMTPEGRLPMPRPGLMARWRAMLKRSA